ncbi:MAG: hypothetical protein PSX80_16305 [bacterium]|nr:hypothetical protein [bacterium]
MTKLRGYIPTMLMLVTLMFGATAANAGIIVGGRTDGATSSTDTNPCEEKTDPLSSVLDFVKAGIIVGGRMGIIVGGRMGIIVGGRTSDSQDTCGIIVGGRTGIIVGG